MKSIILSSYNKNIIRAILGLKVGDIEIPVAGDDDVIIKVYAAPVNPSDIAFIQGIYNVVKPTPAISGFEASGEVVNAGKNVTSLIGSNVSCFVQDNRSGTWSEFVVTNKSNIIVLKEDMNMNQAACFTVNPFTAYGMFDIALMSESKAIIQNASGGQVAAFMRMMAAENNIEVIDIVRKKETAEFLIMNGSKHVLVETDENFTQKLTDLAHRLDANIAFDAVGGSLSGTMYNAMPNDSELIVYGGLSGNAITNINVMDVIFKNKIITGFNLMDWKDELGDGEFDIISDKLQDKFISGDYFTKIRNTFLLTDIVKGLRSYISDMSSGKILITP